MPYFGETKVEVAFSGSIENGEDVKPNTKEPMKVLPPWMIKEGMNLTKEPCGESRSEAKMGGTSTSLEFSDDKKSTVVDEEKEIQDAYVQAYYAAFLQRQAAVNTERGSCNNAISNDAYNSTSPRQVRMKLKHDEEDDEEWEEASTIDSTSELLKVDLNEEAEASDDDEDENNWEDG